MSLNKDHPPPPPPRHSSAVPAGANGSGGAFAFWQNQSGSTPTNPNVLMQQSLQAGRIAQSLKRAEAKLEQERVLEVLKSSAPSAKDRDRDGSKRTRSESPTKGLAALTLAQPVVPRSYSVSSGSGSSTTSSLLSDPQLRSSASAPAARGPALPPRRRASPPSTAYSGRSGRSEGTIMSASSFREVANANLPSRRSESRERRTTPPPQHPDLVEKPQQHVPPSLPLLASNQGPPPTHPDRKLPPPLSATSSVFSDGPEQDFASNPSPTSRVFRSKSMHHPVSPSSSTGPPVPPRPRRRPESVQFGSSHASNASSQFDRDTPRAASPTFTDRTDRTDRSSRSVNTVLSSPASLPMRGSASHGGVSRHLSLSTHSSSARARRSDSFGGGKDGMANLREPIVGLKDKLLGLRPGLDAARYKAEAGLSRRGFVNHRNGSFFREESEDRLVADLTGDDSVGESALEDEGGFGQDVDGPSVDRDYPGESDEERRARISRDGGRAMSENGRRSGEGRYKRPWEVERDEMKWPVAPGEGWTQL